MFNNKVSKAVRIALAFGAASTAAFSVNAIAADNEEDKVERIEVTGSSIKGTDLAGALPVSIISAEDIKNTGVTSVTDLVQQIPSMQGFTTPVSSVGGGGAGATTASLRGLGSAYTLVLLNGRRLAPVGSGSAVNLNTIPLAAIERVEVLSDGASALYGSDAIAGVINFILKDEVDKSTVSLRTDRPSDGGETVNFGFTTGFGDIDSDGFNVVLTVSHDSQDALKSTDRDFAKTGLLEFTLNEQQYFQVNGSPNAIPANAFVFFKEGSGRAAKSFNPYRLKNGSCAPQNGPDAGSQQCLFDYTSTLEVFPESERNSILLHSNFVLSDNLEGFATFNYTDFDTTPRIAPNPTGGINIGTGPLYENYVKEHLTPEEQADVDFSMATWRAFPGGNRTSNFATKSYTGMFGVEGTIGDSIDFSTSVSISNSERTETFEDGHFFKTWRPVIAEGKIDVFVTPDEFTDESLAELEKLKWKGLNWTETTNSLVWDVRASQPVFELPGGDAYVGYGADYRINQYEYIRSEENIADTRWLDGGGDYDYDLERVSYGAFAELQLPVIDDLLVSAAVRYDFIGGIDNSGYVFDDGSQGSKTVNDDENDTTYKVSFRYTATDDIVLRGSIGTGFRSASMVDYARPLSRNGVTAAPYTCPAFTDDARKKACANTPAPIQYNILRRGNAELLPETSEQSSFGFVYAPSTDFSVEVDYWSVEITNQVSSPTQNYAFANALTLYDESFIDYPDPNDNTRNLIHFVTQSINIGTTKTSGYDWRVDLSNDLSFGTLKSSIQGTYIAENTYTRAGTADDFTSSLGRYGSDQEVVFRNQINAQTSLSHGDFSHTLRMSYKSGYRDSPETVTRGTMANPETETYYDKDGKEQTRFAQETVQLKIPSHATFSYKFDYYGFNNTVITAGVKNIFDKAPPMVLGDAEGHLVGYEGRYYDQFLRTYYLSVDFSF